MTCLLDQLRGRISRYITRPALANERVQINSAGQVVLKLKTAWRDGTTHIVLSPLEFMKRLGALVPRPRPTLSGGSLPSFDLADQTTGLVRSAPVDQVG